MLDIKFIRENPDVVQKNAERRGYKIDIAAVIKLDEERRAILQEIEQIRSEQNKQPKSKPSATQLKTLKVKSEQKKELEKRLNAVEEELQQMARKMPNMVANDTPDGGEDDAVEIRKVGKLPDFDFTPKDHLELGEALNLIDVNRGAKVAGARFAYLKNQLVLLEQAIIRYAFDVLVKDGFEPVEPPFFVSDEAMAGMGYLERGEGTEKYHFEADKLYLLGTAEHALGPMHKDEILEATQLPRRYAGISPCFRREAGSYGKDTRGIIRMHQFNKVEQVMYTTPEDSYKYFHKMESITEKLFKSLEIPFRVVAICSGDIGNKQALQYDIEAWFPGQNEKKGAYREVTSCSNCLDYQSVTLNTKYLTKDGEKKYVHMLNNTMIATARAIAAILENNQTAKGTVKIPKVLWKYMNGIKEIKRK